MKTKIKLLSVFMFSILMLSGSMVYAGSGGGYAKKERGYLSQHLPEWIDVDVELRHRFESRDDFDFNSSVDDDDEFHLWRSRVNLTLKPTEDLSLYYTFQDSRITGDEHQDSIKNKFENWHDTKKLYLKYKHAFSLEAIGLEDTTLVLGRQPLVYGKERLLGDSGWDNLGQTFDAARVKLYFHNLKVDVFTGTKTDKKTPREHDDLYEGGTKDRVTGYYAKYKGLKKTKVEQYLLHRKTNKAKTFGPSASGELDEYTAGGRLYGHLGDTNFDYEFEGAYQWGDMDALDISAWMAVAAVGYNFEHEWKPRLGFEFDYASGDSDKTDGDRNTFDNLYPANHDKYGFMDRVSLQNVNIYSIQSSVKPSDKLKLTSDFHFIYLDSQNDYLFDSTGKKVRSTTGSSYDRHVGNELDLTASYDVNKHMNLLVGYSHFFAGDWADDSGEDDDADYVYVQTTVKF